METFSDLLIQEMEGEARAVNEHPDARVLAAFSAGKLAEPEETSVIEHLGRCRDCADQLLFCAEPVAEENAGVADFEKERAWKELEAVIEPGRREGWLGTRWLAPYAVAASLALAFVGYRLHEAQSALDALARPQVGAAIIDVNPGAIRDFRTATANETTVVELGPAERSFTLIIPVKVAGLDVYRLAILDGAGDEIWVDPDLPVDDLGVANLWLPRAFVPAGEYFIEITATEGGKTRDTWVYPLTVRDL